MTSGKSLMSTGTESRVHASNLLLCHDVLVTLNELWRKLTNFAPSITRQVSDINVSCHPYVCFSHVAY